MKRFFQQFKFWIEWAYWLRCKHLCIGCKYYDRCKDEVEDFEDKIEIQKFFD